MKQLFILFIFVFTSSIVFAQSDSLIIGTYKNIVEKGFHYAMGNSYGDMHSTSYISMVDTTIISLLRLDLNHTAVLQIDTVGFSFGFRIKAERKWYGKWKITKDTLLITFTELSTLWSILPKSKPIIEKLSTKIIFEFVLDVYKNRLSGLKLANDKTIVYSKEELAVKMILPNE